MLAAGVSRFLPTSRRLVQFSEGKSAPEGATIVYIDGAFDVFHVGHVEILRVSLDGGAERGSIHHQQQQRCSSSIAFWLHFRHWARTVSICGSLEPHCDSVT